MDDRRSDGLTGTVVSEPSRRQMLISAAIGLLALAPLEAAEDAAAREKGKKKQQIKSFRFQANTMTGAQEVLPTVGDPNGSGSA